MHQCLHLIHMSHLPGQTARGTPLPTPLHPHWYRELASYSCRAVCKSTGHSAAHATTSFTSAYRSAPNIDTICTCPQVFSSSALTMHSHDLLTAGYSNKGNELTSPAHLEGRDGCSGGNTPCQASSERCHVHKDPQHPHSGQQMQKGLYAGRPQGSHCPLQQNCTP